jgi:CheY-like chemotaxis protein
MGGSASVDYQASGVSWEITLPLPQIAPIEMGVRRETALPALDSRALGDLKGKRILVVEDEPIVALELASILEEAHAIPNGPVATAAQALALLESTPVDAVLLDGNLHGAPVDSIAAALTRRRIPFIFVTGYTAENLPRSYAHIPVLTKPFNQTQLVACLLLAIGCNDDIQLGEAC